METSLPQVSVRAGDIQSSKWEPGALFQLDFFGLCIETVFLLGVLCVSVVDVQGLKDWF